MVGGDGGGVVFWAGAGRFLFDGGKDEVGAGTMEVYGASGAVLVTRSLVETTRLTH